MILELDGTTTDVGLYDLAVSLKLPIKNQDASGSSSSTGKLNAGTKAKQLGVSGRLGFDNASQLAVLIKLAEALTSSGTRAVYNIVDDTADAANINRVTFDGDLDVRKIDGLQAWAVTFGLAEYLSTAERIEAQRTAGYTSAGTATDTAPGTAAAGTETDSSDIDRDSTLYKVFSKIDGYLANLMDDDQ